MESITSIEIPLTSLTCGQCLDGINHERTEISVPFQATNVTVPGDEDLEPLTVTLDVRKISWHKQSTNRYVATALVTVSCPCCEKARDIQQYLEAPSILLTDIGKCRICKGILEIDEEDIEYLDLGSGHWEVDIRANLICRACSINETRDIHIPVKQWDQFRQTETLEINLTDSPSGKETTTPYNLNNENHEGSENMASDLQTGKAFKVFISYSHQDRPLRDQMEKSLEALKQQGLISTWHDGQIMPGQKWETHIMENRDTAEIALFLVSPDFMASDYIQKKELKQILEREKAGKVYILVVLLQPTYLNGTELAKFQMLPINSKGQLKPVAEWSNRNRAFLQVAEGIHRVVMQLRQ